jgi:hypothetical protein
VARLRRQARYGFADDGSEPSPHLRGRPTTRLIEWLAPKVVVGLFALLLLAILVFSVGGLIGGSMLLPYRAGWAGVPGTAAPVGCTSGSRDQSGTCYATFVPAAGTPDVDRVVVEGRGMLADHDYPARLHPDGRTVSLVGSAGALSVVAALFGLFVGVVLSVGLLGIGVHATARRWLGPRQPRDYRLPLRVIAVTSGVLGVAAIALYLVARARVG